MKLATTTGDFGTYYDNDFDKLRAVARAGFKYVDLNLYDGDTPGWAYYADDWEEKVEKLGVLAEDLGLKFVQSHAPGSCVNAFAKDNDILIRGTLRSIEICARLGIPYTVAHTGTSPDMIYGEPGHKEKYFEASRRFLENFYPLMEKTGVSVLIENSCNINMGGKWFFMEGCEMREFIEICGSPLVHAVWDVGHANQEGHQYKDIMDLGDELRALHIHDNRKGDDHMMPFTGSTNYDDIMSALIDSGYKGYFTFESENTLYNHKRWKRREAQMQHGKRFLRPPIELQDQVEKLLYSIGKYILTTYGVFEE